MSNNVGVVSRYRD